MSIDSLRSGAIRICFDPSLNAYPNRCRILVEGQMLDTGMAEDGELIKMPSLKDVDLLFGEGSIIAEGLRTAFLCCPEGVMEFYALPHKDASVGADQKASYAVTFTGVATTDGRADLFLVDGRYNTSTRVYEGDTADVVATNVATDLNATPGLPFVAVAAGGVVTLTAKNAGTVGNAINIIYNWHQRRGYAPVGIEAEVALVTEGTHIDFVV